MELVEVIWLDAGFESCTMELEETKRLSPMFRKNVGFLLADTKEKITLGFGYIEDIEHKKTIYDGILVIPKAWTTKIRRIK